MTKINEKVSGVKYLVSGKYNPAHNDFIFYENGANCFWAADDGKKIEIYSGSKEGGGNYYELPLTAKTGLLTIVDEGGRYSTRQLVNFAKKNSIWDTTK